MNSKKMAALAVLVCILAAALPGSAGPPKLIPTTTLQHQAVDIGNSAFFRAAASGDVPLSFQWLLDGQPLPGQTDPTLTFKSAHPTNEGNYTVIVSNALGTVTSEPVRLTVVPPATAFIRDNFTNALGRLPYFYLLPTNYSAARSYPLEFLFHGSPGDENGITNASGYATAPGLKVLASYRQQDQDPVILLFPTRRAGDASWTDSYLQQSAALLDQFISTFSVDTNRIYVVGVSEGVHAAWDVIAKRPGFFAAAMLAAGWPGTVAAPSLKSLPAWAWCASNDDFGQCPNTRQLVRALRVAGWSVPYTEYMTGGHVNGILMGCSTPALGNWLLSQRRGAPSTAEPLLTISNPTAQPAWSTGATNLSLSGSTQIQGQRITTPSWENTANNAKGTASGSNVWSIAGLPLQLNRTNIIMVTATTTSWAPAYAGGTTFNATIAVAAYPILARVTSQGTNALLSWTGGAPPYRIQHATDLAAGNWADFLPNASPPVVLSPTSASGFFRVVGQ